MPPCVGLVRAHQPKKTVCRYDKTALGSVRIVDYGIIRGAGCYGNKTGRTSWNGEKKNQCRGGYKNNLLMQLFMLDY